MRLARIVAAVVVVPLVLCGLLEIGLRVEGTVRSRPTDRPPPGTTVVLCVGDSHTRGLPDPDNYPVQLQRLLDERAPGRYRVVNLGVPGLTTAQLRARLTRWLAYYRPSATIVWGGVDNGWRQDETPWRPRAIARLGSRSRAVQFLRLVVLTGGLRFPRLETAGFEAADWRGVHAVWRVEFAGERDQIETVPRDALPPDEVEATTRADVRAIVESTRDAGGRAYAITYAFPGGYFQNANRAVRAVAGELGFPIVDTAAVVARVHKETPGEPLFDATVHPRPILYRGVADAVYAALVADGAVAAGR
jgi:GDSL-like Lipase/Acylhydrolase family